MSSLVEKLHAIHDALGDAGLPHAFGGAIALAYCVEEPRGTRDLDVNIFVDVRETRRALGALPEAVSVSDADIATVERDGQTRLDWEGTPVDVFLNNLPLHEAVAASISWVPLAGREVPVLDCASLVIFKAFFDRTKDWADLESIAEVAPEDIETAMATIAELTDPEDPAVRRLRSLLSGTDAA